MLSMEFIQSIDWQEWGFPGMMHAIPADARSPQRESEGKAS